MTINNIRNHRQYSADVAKNVMPSIVAITGISIQEIPNYFVLACRRRQYRAAAPELL